jgi:hypothetical protein
MAEEDTKVFHYGESVIMAGVTVTLKVSSLRLSGTGHPANGVTWSKATVVSNRHSRRRNCFAGEHKPPLRIDGLVAIGGQKGTGTTFGTTNGWFSRPLPAGPGPGQAGSWDRRLRRAILPR